MKRNTIAEWHEIVRTRGAHGFGDLLANDVVFYSPVVHTPQRGKAVATMYLSAAIEVLGNGRFRYLREVLAEREAVMEFETEIDGILVNGVDMIKWNDVGQITEFKVMIRPLKAINLIHQQIGESLQRAASIE